MIKCPVCGYEFGKVIELSNDEIKNIMKDKPESLLTSLRFVVSLIKKNIPSDDNSKSQNMFLRSIAKCKNKAVLWAVDQYVSSGYVYQGKGFKYLRKMIINHELDRKEISKHERKRFGTTPPVKKIGK